MIKDLFAKYKFDYYSDRIGPDCLFTHWNLYFKSTMRALCQKKFGYFGTNAEFRPGAYAIYCSQIKIGSNVIIRPQSMLFADENTQIIIEDNVLIGSGVHIYVDNHRYDDISLQIIEQGYYPSKEVILKSGSWIGANAIILPGVTIGHNSVIGAGSIVTKSIPDYCVAAGNPAKIIKNLKNES